MVSNELKIVGDESVNKIDYVGEFGKSIDIRKMQKETEKVSPFLLDCIRNDINDNPYDTHERHPIQKTMRI